MSGLKTLKNKTMKSTLDKLSEIYDALDAALISTTHYDTIGECVDLTEEQIKTLCELFGDEDVSAFLNEEHTVKLYSADPEDETFEYCKENADELICSYMEKIELIIYALNEKQ